MEPRLVLPCVTFIFVCTLWNKYVLCGRGRRAHCPQLDTFYTKCMKPGGLSSRAFLPFPQKTTTWSRASNYKQTASRGTPSPPRKVGRARRRSALRRGAARRRELPADVKVVYPGEALCVRLFWFPLDGCLWMFGDGSPPPRRSEEAAIRNADRIANGKQRRTVAAVARRGVSQRYVNV